MPVPDHLLPLWRAFDARTGNVRPTWWGAVVTDDRFPAIWDVNYARVETGDGTLTADELEATVFPSLGDMGALWVHVVGFRPEEQAGLFAELEARGHVVSWDLVMELEGDGPALEIAGVQEVVGGVELRAARRASYELFGIEEARVQEELLAMEDVRDGDRLKRWFCVRDEEGIASVAALTVLEGVGYIDEVSTVERARGRGYASALTTALAREARGAGARHVCLLVDPDAPAVIAMYERLGFRESGRLPSMRRPMPQAAPRSGGDK